MNLQRIITLALLPLLAAGMALGAVTKTFTIKEPFSLDWGPDRVNYKVDFPAGEVVPQGVALADAAGNAVPAQLSAITLCPDGRTVKSATLSFMVTLKPDENASWTMTAGKEAVNQPAADLKVNAGNDVIELSNARVGVRLAGGEKKFDPPAAADQVPAPIQGALINGKWTGAGWWSTDVACTGYNAKVLDAGPVFARVALQYTFEGNTSYSAVVELAAGQDVAVVTEEYDMSKGKTYEMPELGGVKPGQKFQFVKPRFATPEEALMWDWWMPTGGKVPSPNCYHVVFSDGGKPAQPATRITGINAYGQWIQPETMIASVGVVPVMGLRPGEWVHPDIDPHPNASMKQYVQTGNLWLDKAGETQILRAPTCMGKRVYGIGAPGSPSGLRYIRMGRTQLDHVKDWVLDYPETSKYPRLFVDAGDMERMKERARKQLMGMQHIRWANYLTTGNPQTGKMVIDECIKGLEDFVRQFCNSDYNLMMYGINAGVIAHQADIALAVPEITPEQAAKIRHYLAAMVYYSLDNDYLPPRTAGFAWGSANMMPQVRARVALLASLLPNHPQGETWRKYMANWLTAYAESQINEAGATLECPHYGGMETELCVVPMMAMMRAGKVDSDRLLKRYQANARQRLGTLLPWDVRGNFRSCPPIGDGYYATDGTFGMLAAFLEKADPQLTKELRWGIQESGADWGGHPIINGALIDPSTDIAQPDLKSTEFPGAGFTMRNGFPSHEETFFMVTAGGFSVGHGHSDRGAWTLYSKGAPLMVDFAAMYTPSIAEAWLHPGGLSFDHDEADATKPFTCLEPGWDPSAKTQDDAFGTVSGFTSLPAADYAQMTRRINFLNRVPYKLMETHKELLTRGDSPEVWAKEPFNWTRRYVLVKDANLQGHNYIVIRDDLAGNKEFNPALNLWCLADKLEVNGPLATYTGQHGVDLDCYVAEPAAFTYRTHTVSHPCGFGFANYYKKTFGKDFQESQILCQIPQAPGKGGYFVALVPRKHEEAAPKFTTLPGGNAIQAVFPDRTDTVVLLNQPGEVKLEGLTLNGTAFVLTKVDKKLTITMLAPGTVKKGSKVLLSGETAKTVEVK